MDEGAVAKIAELGSQAADVNFVQITESSIRADPIPLIATPQVGGGVAIKSVKKELDEWRTAPERITGTARADTLLSFIDLTKRHSNKDSVLFGDFGQTPSLTAVIDYHTEKHEPRFAKHRIVYNFPLSVEWKAWRERDGKSFSQNDWACFIEDHISELAEPSGVDRQIYEALFHTKFALPSDLMQLSRGMEIAVEARVKEVRVLQSGETEVSYEETHKDARGQKLIVPGLFVISIPLFLGAETNTRLIARLRYRRQDNKILWFYQIYQVDAVIRQELDAALLYACAATELPGFVGIPE